jgi:hypothetical protein
MDRMGKLHDHHKGSKTQRTARVFDRIYKIGKYEELFIFPIL